MARMTNTQKLWEAMCKHIPGLKEREGEVPPKDIVAPKDMSFIRFARMFAGLMEDPRNKIDKRKVFQIMDTYDRRRNERYGGGECDEDGGYDECEEGGAAHIDFVAGEIWDRTRKLDFDRRRISRKTKILRTPCTISFVPDDQIPNERRMHITDDQINNAILAAVVFCHSLGYRGDELLKRVGMMVRSEEVFVDEINVEPAY